ncbi:ylmG homolog protein 2, chloroplastic [Momordica charantia]|uniref:YlmG homolog protein 2, chloroplastic n=1 Tax=Momordica charantia TaxID=3673 RepID=A0A6J1BR74_MOMCH|nr:ylmG homolog protein 2, chloroplastic [Momordica charantia]
MAPDESSVLNPRRRSTGFNFVPNCVSSFSPAFSQTAFGVSRRRHADFGPPCNFLRDLHESFASTAEKCIVFVHSLASENPFLKKLLSLSSEFQSFRHQIHCMNSRNFRALSSHNFAAVLPGDSLAGIVVSNGIQNFLSIYNTLLVVRLVLTWFPNTPPAIVSPLSTLCDPYLNIFRGIIPPLGGTLDLSPILAFLVLNAFTSTAAALPAELPVPNTSLANPTPLKGSADLTTSQNKWMRRLQGIGTRNADGSR